MVGKLTDKHFIFLCYLFLSLTHTHTPPHTAEPTDLPRKSSLTHKKGSMHFMKKDGKDDTSTFVIQEGLCLCRLLLHSLCVLLDCVIGVCN